MNSTRGTPAIAACALLATGAVFLAGCASDNYAAQGAAQGATTGALAGAVGAAATALIFGGDVGEAAARGAVYGGTTGAVSGGIAGSQTGKRVAAQQAADREREIARFKDEIGTDAFNGFVALAECKHDVAVANAREAQRSSNRDYALAGLWVEALTEADRKRLEAARSLLPEISATDAEVGDEAQAEALMNEWLIELGEIRVEYDLAHPCTR